MDSDTVTNSGGMWWHRNCYHGMVMGWDPRCVGRQPSGSCARTSQVEPLSTMASWHGHGKSFWAATHQPKHMAGCLRTNILDHPRTCNPLKCANSVTAVPWNPVPLVGALPCPQRSIQSIHLQLMASEGGVVWNRPATLETSGRSGDVGEIWIEKQDETGQVAPSSRGFVGLKAACSGTKWLTTAGLTTTPL
jgi:hypothetical protein